jgi:hypothetical protein
LRGLVVQVVEQPVEPRCPARRHRHKRVCVGGGCAGKERAERERA